jgi:hypothetical protein
MEQLLFLVVLVAAALVNILVRWARQRAEAPPRDSGPERPGPRHSGPARRRPTERRERAGTAPVRSPAPRPELPVLVPRRSPLPPPAALVRRRRPVHRRLGRHADLRHAIVVMTILAPCRALEGDSGLRSG